MRVYSGFFVSAPEANVLKYRRAGGSTVITSISLNLRSLEILKGSSKTNCISILVYVMFFAYQVNLALVAFSDFT